MQLFHLSPVKQAKKREMKVNTGGRNVLINDNF